MTDYVKTGIDSVDNLMGGGLICGCPHAVYGKYKNGKSILVMQTACMCTRDKAHGGLGRPALIYDTECFWNEENFNQWYSYFKARFPDLPTKPNIDVVQTTTLFELANEFGFTINIHRKESKTEPVVSFPKKQAPKTGKNKDKPIKETEQSLDWLERSPVWKRFDEKNYGIVLVDSFSMLFKDIFESAQQNFPGRSSAQRIFLSNVRALAARKGCVTLITCHEIGSMTGPQPWGGESIPYYIKHILQISEGNKIERAKFGDTTELEKKNLPYGDKTRRLRMVKRWRHPTKVDGVEVPTVIEQDLGFTEAIVGDLTSTPIAEDETTSEVLS